MPNIINLRLLENKNIIAELNGIPLAQENSYKIIAGEENATQFKIASKPSQYIEARYTVEMVNAQGFGVEETDIIQDTFALPKGMAVAGYGFVQIKAYQGEEIVPFMTLKVKVWNTLPNWKEHISDGGDIDLSAYQKKTDNSLETESKEVVGAINEVNSKVGQGGSGSQLDVQIDGQSIVKDGVANIPLAKKLDKVSGETTNHQAYCKLTNGNQHMFALENGPVAGTICMRDGNGRLRIEDPVGATDCLNLRYFNSNKGTKLYIREIELSGESHNIAFMLITIHNEPYVNNGVLKIKEYDNYDIISGYIEDELGSSKILFISTNAIITVDIGADTYFNSIEQLMGNEPYTAIETISPL